MRLDGRRTSNNVDDRRGRRSGGGMGGFNLNFGGGNPFGSGSGKKIGCGGGIGTIILLVIVFFMSGGDLGSMLGQLMGGSLTGVQGDTQTEYVETENQRQLAQFASQILAGTEDVWTQEFRNRGWGEYRAPKMVLFTDAVSSGCGNASSQMGPFYCSADETVYIDLSFFEEMQQKMGAGGDFAYAYVIAHEVGHHVQHLLGTLDQAHAQMNRVSKEQANQISVRLELQADFYAGVWANRDNEMFNSLEPGDVEEAINAASKIGDDYLQRQAYGREMPDSFTHGRSEQRMRWLQRGINTGDPTQGDTFTPSYSSL